MPAGDRTFVHMSFQLPHGVSPAAERALWRHGILTWQDFRWRGRNLFSPQRTGRLLQAILAAEELLASQNWRDYLRCQHPIWLLRLMPVFRPHAYFLDVETTGVRSTDPPVTVAVCRQSQVSFFVAGVNFPELTNVLKQVPLLVTFYGRRFDLPRLRRFGILNTKIPQLDLAPIARKLGFGPGLKGSLRQLGWTWPPGLPQAGAEAPALWHRYQAGSLQALRTLLLYNAYDTVTLDWLWTNLYNVSLRDWPLFRPLALPKIPDVAPAVDQWIKEHLPAMDPNG